MKTHTLRYALLGIIAIVAVVAVGVLSIAQFNRAFDSSVPLTVDSPRAGLLLTTGNEVKMRGVTVGRIESVSVTTTGARLGLGIFPGELHLIPSDVTARIVPPTLFGDKYVELAAPQQPADGSSTMTPIAAHATIDADHVTVEINDTFANLVALLNATQPSKINAALTALADALDGRGDQLGDLISQLDTYLRQINPSLGTLSTTLPLAKSVLGTYSDLTPNLLQTARDLTTTSNTIQANKTSLDAFLLSLTAVSKKVTPFLQANDQPLLTALGVLETPLKTLARYSPEFPCFFKALADTGLPLASQAIGGVKPGLNLLAQLLPPEAPYSYPKDLPVVKADTGPRCYDLPNVPLDTKFSVTEFDTGVAPYADETAPGISLPLLLKVLFGTATGAGS